MRACIAAVSRVVCLHEATRVARTHRRVNRLVLWANLSEHFEFA